MNRSAPTSGRFQRVSWIETTGSTNADLQAEAAIDPTVARVLFADEQTAGRGRLDRTWDQQKGGGLMVSFFVPWREQTSSHLVPTALGVSIVEVIENVGRTVGLKWPNDIVVGGDAVVDGVAVGGAADPIDRELGGMLKLGGMLSSAVVVAGAFAGVVAGLGCNVSWPPPNFVDLPDATSLNNLPGHPVDIEDLAAVLVSTFDLELSTLQQRGPEQLLDRYRQRCVTIGERVRVEIAGATVEGLATDIDPSGALLIDVDGRQRRVDVGDVIHLRPASR